MKPILVTGVQRSGLSIVAKIISITGAYSGKVNTMQENALVNSHLDTYYKTIGMDEKGQYPLPNVRNLVIPGNWGQQISDLLVLDGWNQKTPPVIKGNRLAQTWPIWNFAFPDARWIIVRRRTGDIVNSCIKTAYMQAFQNTVFQKQVGAKNEQEGWLWWVREHEARFVEMISSGLDCKVVWPERMVEGDYSQIYEMLNFLGLPWKDEIITKIDPLLYRTRKNKEL